MRVHVTALTFHRTRTTATRSRGGCPPTIDGDWATHLEQQKGTGYTPDSVIARHLSQGRMVLPS
jgi:hypothetical protein